MRFSRTAAIVFFVALTCARPRPAGATDAGIVYRLRYDLSAPSLVHVTLNFSVTAEAPVALIMPRSFPGGYVQRPYDPFVTNVKALAVDGGAFAVRREELGPRWSIGKCCDRVSRIEY